jgi:tRNA (mo5U34)-methyltransferase
VVLADEVRRRFEVDDSIVSALPGAELEATSSLDRSRIWRRTPRPKRASTVEFLVPRIVRKIQREWPSYLARAGADGLSAREVAARITELGPWRLPYRLHHQQFTMNEIGWRVARERILFRRDLIAGTVATLLGENIGASSVLDLGCNSGFFSLELAARGAAQVDGVDLRQENIDQARFLAAHYDLHATFSTTDVKALAADQRWDVVLNLGLLYHVTDPLELLGQTYALCRRFAIIDTKCELEPVSAFLLLGEKDVNRPTEGSAAFELHPTYRGAIDTIRYAGFSEVIEIVGLADPPHPTYSNGTRRCFLAIK